MVENGRRKARDVLPSGGSEVLQALQWIPGFLSDVASAARGGGKRALESVKAAL